MRPSPHHPQTPDPTAVLWVYPEQQRLSSPHIHPSMPVRAGWCRDSSREPGWSPGTDGCAGMACSRERTLPWHPPGCSGASLEATPAGLAQTLCGHSERPRGPQNPRGVTPALPTATAPTLRRPCGQAWPCASTGASSHRTGDKVPLPQARHEGKDCLAQHPAVPPCQHRAGMGLHDPRGTGWVYLSVTRQVPVCSPAAHACPCGDTDVNVPQSRHTYMNIV